MSEKVESPYRPAENLEYAHRAFGDELINIVETTRREGYEVVCLDEFGHPHRVCLTHSHLTGS